MQTDLSVRDHMPQQATKRVLHVMASLQRSGMEVMLLNSWDEWRRHGFVCDILATSAEVGPIAPHLRENGYGIFHIPFRGQRSYLPRATFFKDYFRLCRSGYDVVHIHTEGGRPFFAVLAKLAGIRTIAVTPHGIFAFKGALRLRKLIERHLIRALGGRFGIISESIKNCEWERFRIRGVRIRNWIDASYFRPPSTDERAAARQSLDLHDDEFAIVSVGNCSPVKNHSSILRALSLLPDTLRPRYIHVGREDDSHAERELAADIPRADRVSFLGSQTDVLPFLWAADVFVMPSLGEGLGLSAIEAIAAGVPLVCSNVAGLADVAAQTKWTVLTSTHPESVASGLISVASRDISERRLRALEDSQAIRARYSVPGGVQSIVAGLYGEAKSDLWMEREPAGQI